MSKPMVLITRPEADSKIIANTISQKSFEPLIEPLLKVEHIDFELPDLSEYGGLVFTSANGVRAYREKSRYTDIRAYVVGTNTEEAAIANGFEEVHCANGTVEDLAELIEGTADERPFLYVRGENVSKPLKQLMDEKQNEFYETIVYRTVESHMFSENFLENLEYGKINCAMFFSKRSAEVFVTLIKRYEREEMLGSIKALCIGGGVLECLSVLPWEGLYVAAKPDRTGMMALLDQTVGKH